MGRKRSSDSEPTTQPQGLTLAYIKRECENVKGIPRVCPKKGVV